WLSLQYARKRRHSFSRRQTRFQSAAGHERARHSARANVQTFRIRRRREPQETRLASKEILDRGFAISIRAMARARKRSQIGNRNSPIILGAHISIRGGASIAIERARSIRC